MKRLFILFLFSCILICGCWDNRGKYKQFNNVRVFYTKAVTVEEVDKLGVYLAEAFDERKFTDGAYRPFKLDHKGNTFEVYISVKAGVENEEGIQYKYMSIARLLSVELFHGSDVDIHLSDGRFVIRRTIYYSGE